MIAIDTNILVRYFVQDDPVQARLAEGLLIDRLTEREPGLVTVVALVEMIWVLERVYGVAETAVKDIILALLELPTVTVEQAEAVAEAVSLRHGDLADRLIHCTGAIQGCDRTLTFDHRFARLEGVDLLI